MACVRQACGVRKLHILRFRLRQKLSRSAAPPFPTANAVAGVRRGPLVWVKGRTYLYFWLSATASSGLGLLEHSTASGADFPFARAFLFLGKRVAGLPRIIYISGFPQPPIRRSGC